MPVFCSLRSLHDSKSQHGLRYLLLDKVTVHLKETFAHVSISRFWFDELCFVCLAYCILVSRNQDMLFHHFDFSFAHDQIGRLSHYMLLPLYISLCVSIVYYLNRALSPCGMSAWLCSWLRIVSTHSLTHTLWKWMPKSYWPCTEAFTAGLKNKVLKIFIRNKWWIQHTYCVRMGCSFQYSAL